MKTNRSLLVAATLLIAGLAAVRADGTPPSQPLNPATGLPVSPATPQVVDAAKAPGQTRPGNIDPAFQAAQDANLKVHELTASGDYDEALKECLRFHAECKGDHTLVPLVANWVELGRRFPAARKALMKIRDDDNGEFSAGRGYAALFSEIKAINASWNDDEATWRLFKVMMDKDRQLAQQCYGEAQDLMVKRGEYALCLEFIGDPRDHFDSLRDEFQRRVAMEQRQIEWQRQLQERQDEMMKQHDHGVLPPRFVPPWRFDLAKQATNNFVGQVLILEKILTGAGKKADAEKIHAQALAVADDPRLH